MADIVVIQTQLAEARAALHQLQIGTKTVSVKYDGREISYQITSIDRLQSYIRDLEQQLAVATGVGGRRRALRVTFG